MSAPGWHTAIRRLVSIATGLGVLMVAIAVVSAGTLRPGPERVGLAGEQVQVDPVPLVLTCPDAPRVVTGEAGGEIDYDAEFATDTQEQLTRTDVLVLSRDSGPASPVRFGALSGEPTSVEDAGAVTVGQFAETSDYGVIMAEPQGSSAALGAATVSTRSDSGDLRGLTAAPCLSPSTTQWLVGGATEIGSSARLNLTNPGTTPATARIDVWGGFGPIDGRSGILIPPGQTYSVLLETLSLTERLAVRVSAEGGQVSSSLHVNTLNGVVPAGTDVLTVAADPTTELYIGPVLIAEHDSDATVRLVNPDPEQPARIDIRLLTPQGERGLAGAQDILIEPGTVAEVSLAGVEPGAVSVHVHSDVPVTGAVLREFTGQAGDLDPNQPSADRAWLAASAPQDRGVLAFGTDLADDVRVLVANPSAQSQDVLVTGVTSTGERLPGLTVRVEARSSTLVELPDDVIGVQVDGEQILASAMLHAWVSDGELLAMVPLAPDPDSTQQVLVRVGSS